MLGLFAVLFALVLSFGLAWTYALLLYWADRHEKEPKRLLLGMFFWGAVISIIGSLVFSLTLDAGLALVMRSASARDFISTAVIAPLVEETMKGLGVLVVYLVARDEFDSLFDGVVYAALIGLGFEAVENFLYIVSSLEEGLGSYLMVTALRLGLFGFTHPFFTSFVGLGVAAFRLYRNRWWAWFAPPAGWMAAVFTHALHNATVSTGTALCLVAVVADWTGLFMLIGILFWAIRRERQWMRVHLEEEVRLGLISPGHYATALSPRRRWQALRLAKRMGRKREASRFYKLLAELAFLKAHMARGHQGPREHARLQTLRQAIAQLAPQVPG